MEAKTVSVPKALLEKFTFDEAKGEYYTLIPLEPAHQFIPLEMWDLWASLRKGLDRSDTLWRGNSRHVFLNQRRKYAKHFRA
jgi:hypothetical protein